MFAERYGAAWTASDPERLLGFFASDGVYEDVGTQRLHRGHDDIARFHRGMLSFAHDSKVAFEVPAGDTRRFALPWTWSGTNTGPLVLHGRRYEPTGRQFSVRGIALCTAAEDGLLTLHRDIYDMHAVLRDLGLLEDAPLDLAHRAYIALASGDEDELLAVLDPDFRVTFAAGMPAAAGAHVGAGAARDAWWRIGERYAVRAQPEEFIPCADGRLLVTGRYRGRARSGHPVDARFMHLWTARRGRLAALEQLTDTAGWAR